MEYGPILYYYVTCYPYLPMQVQSSHSYFICRCTLAINIQFLFYIAGARWEIFNSYFILSQSRVNAIAYMVMKADFVVTIHKYHEYT